APDGDGGSIDVTANGDIQTSGVFIGTSKGFGQSDEFSFDAGGNVTITGNMDVSGDNFSGDLTAYSDALITVSSKLRTVAPVDPVNFPAAFGGTIDLEGCQINITAAAELDALGPGGDPAGSTFFAASTGMTVAGTLIATGANDFEWRTSAPLITG